MCTSCGGRRQTRPAAGASTYKVIYPEGSGKEDKIVHSEMAAKIASEAFPGARWEKVGS